MEPEPTVEPAARVIPQRPVCAVCGEVIGVYEPLMHVVDEIPRETSIAACREHLPELTGPLWHRDCWPYP